MVEVIEQGHTVQVNIGQQRHSLLKKLFSEEGITRIRSRLPYILEDHNVTHALANLYKKLKVSPVVEPSFTQTLRGAARRSWKEVLGTVAEIACDIHLEQSLANLPCQHRVISNQQLIEAIRQISRTDHYSQLSVERRTFNFTCGTNRFACPDAVITGIFPNRLAFAHTVCEYKATIVDGSCQKAASQLRQLRNIFKDDLAREVFRQAIALNLKAPFKRIILPPTQEVPVKMIALSSHVEDLNHLLRQNSLPPYRCEVIGLDPYQLTQQALRILLGRISIQKGLEIVLDGASSGTRASAPSSPTRPLLVSNSEINPN